MEVCSAVNDVHENFISNLESTFSESLHIQDAPKSGHVSEENDIHDVADENARGGIKQKETKLNMTCLKKSATFPIPHVMLSSSSSDEEADTSVTESRSEHSAHQTFSRSVSLPVSSGCYIVSNVCMSRLSAIMPFSMMKCKIVQEGMLDSFSIFFSFSFFGKSWCFLLHK